ncbi:MAG: molybdopterin oxidoreductase family protein [Acidimicrobiales bacterium]|jgi:anaerobic selenocysteine-containing dehydrogenase|nr:molybdopterin oxidoreductase family protein [Acidimicrobiales bacterium]
MAGSTIEGRHIHIRTCHLCEAMCGLEVHVETNEDGADEVKLIRPDRDDVWSKGYICPKGTTLGHLHHDPDRLRVPMVKDENGVHQEATWDAAFARAEELMAGVIAEHGKEALTIYIGNPAAHNYSISRYTGLMMGLADLPGPIYSAGTVDQWPKNVTCWTMYGNQWRIPAPDLPNTNFIVVMGANPHASQGSLLACPDVLGELDKVRERGKVVVIDPRRTGTVDHADQWLPVFPGTDAALMLAIVHVLYDEGLVELGHLADRVKNLDVLERLAAEFPPERVAATCGVAADEIRTLAQEFAAADKAVWYARIGTCNQEFGTLASWLPDAINIITGNFDTEGGLMWGKPIAWSATLQDRGVPIEFGRFHSRVRGAPEVMGQFPVSCMAEEIATPGDGQLKALVTVAGNPVISAPEADRLDDALPMLDCMISIDNALNETTRHADVIFPGLSPLEQPHYDELLWAWAVRSAGKWSPPLFEPQDGRPGEWEVLLRVGAMMGGIPQEHVDVKAIDDGFFAAFAEMGGADPAVALEACPAPGPERLNDNAIRTGPWGDRYGENPDGLTLESFKDAPHGIDMGPMVPRIDEMIGHTDGMIDIAPPYVVADVPRLEERLSRSNDGLLLTSRRHVRSNNSWMHNVKVLVKGKDRCTLLIHPDDAAASGVADGAVARVTSEAGTLEVPVEVSDEMRPGVVSLPHGWGHDKPGTRMSVAREHAGVNNNVLAPGTFVDVPSGNAAVNGIPVEVAPA